MYKGHDRKHTDNSKLTICKGMVCDVSLPTRIQTENSCSLRITVQVSRVAGTATLELQELLGNVWCPVPTKKIKVSSDGIYNIRVTLADLALVPLSDTLKIVASSEDGSMHIDNVIFYCG